MLGYNKIDIIGYVSNEPEMRFTANGKPVTTFTVPVNRKYKINDEEKEDVEWFAITAWNRLAEICNQFVVKGTLVFVTGRVSLHRWESQDGKEKSRLEINANKVFFLSKPNSTSDAKTESPEEELPY